MYNSVVDSMGRRGARRARVPVKQIMEGLVYGQIYRIYLVKRRGYY